jgi:glucokinase
MYLGIEIGGTKLQLGVGRGDGSPLLLLERRTVDITRGAEGIRTAISEIGSQLVREHACRAVGIGFGGPVDTSRGRTLTSHQVRGWDDFPLREWARAELGVPTDVQNDAETAGLAEALFGAGSGADPVLYITVGTGIGGGLITNRRIFRGSGLGAAEIGHLRPGLDATSPYDTVEGAASGPGIARAAQKRLERARQDEIESRDEILTLAGGDLSRVDAPVIARAAQSRNPLALAILADEARVLGWAIAQAITLFAPRIIVIGGGVSLIGEELFLAPVRAFAETYAFPPFRGSWSIVPAALGEEVVVHGALAVAKTLDAEMNETERGNWR